MWAPEREGDEIEGVFCGLIQVQANAKHDGFEIAQLRLDNGELRAVGGAVAVGIVRESAIPIGTRVRFKYLGSKPTSRPGLAVRLFDLWAQLETCPSRAAAPSEDPR